MPLKSHTGTSFIEVIVSLLLLSIILLELDVLALYALREEKSVYYSTIAINELSNMAERLQSSQFEDIDTQLSWWNQQNEKFLPLGIGKIEQQALTKLTIFWGKDKNACLNNQTGKSGCLSLKI